MSETPVAFARVCLCRVETAIASAGEKWVFLVHFPGAEVTPVSPVLCWGRAVVLLVSTSPRCRASVKSWGCAQVVDGLFVRLLSRPLGVVRIRWGFAAEAGVAVASVVWLRCRWAAVGPGGSGRPTGGRRGGRWVGGGCGAGGRRQGWEGSGRPTGGRREACWAWPGFETTRRAKLVARTASGRAGLAPRGGLAAGCRTEVWRRDVAGS